MCAGRKDGEGAPSRLAVPQVTPGTQALRRGSEHDTGIPSGEISICSTHECGMSKLMSSSSFSCWERWGQGGLGLVRAGPWSTRYRYSLCLSLQGQAWVACQLPQGESEDMGSFDLAWHDPS